MIFYRRPAGHAMQQGETMMAEPVTLEVFSDYV
jgi:hypothetical protein